MAITDIAGLAHLTEDDVERLHSELEDLRIRVQRSLGAGDAAYIRRTIAAQRALEVVARTLIATTRSRRGWAVGTAALALAKIIENMEIGHNVCHGQWDWMNDPEIHSTSWEWDMVGVSRHWQLSHNFLHHRYTNVVGVDDDLGYGIARVTPDQDWRPTDLGQPVRAVLLALLFEWGIALQGYDAAIAAAATPRARREVRLSLLRKATRQSAKDYLVFPLLSRNRWRRTLAADATANIIRNVWAYLVISCGHIPGEAAKFDRTVLDDETPGEWYLRQLLGSTDFRAGPVMGFLSGHLSHQVEHHLFPDAPSNHLAGIKRAVDAICARYGVQRPTHSLGHQIVESHRPIMVLALP
ncbi:fatty acid desaturase family protein [Tsukamurella soli]|uniref:Acyl-CoA desaturase n=1 Tax=Tsukamurella soli TaxID=644556 RepID=A0ABP8JRN3_9ACTN